MLRLPEPGEARAAQLTDNTPVFVSRDADGEVSVLDATSPANPTSLVAWCEADAVLVDGDGVLYDVHGRPVGGTAQEGLRRYPFELVDVSETQAVRITGDAMGGHTDPAEDTVPGCAGEELVVHLPEEHGSVYEGGRMSEEPWVWVRMSSRVVDGDLYLCAGPEPCGEPGEPGVNEVCTYEEPGNEDSESICEPYRDPVIATPGATPSEKPQLMLVSSDDDGRTVEIRRPPTSALP